MTKLIKLYGERNTNTNYVSKLIELNLQAQEIPGTAPRYVQKLGKALRQREYWIDLYFQLNYHKNLGWKHTCVKTQKELNNHRLNNPELSFLTITKNPYSWLLSLHRRPYHQKIDRNLSFEQFLQSKWTTLKRDNSAPVLNSPIELWNIKNRSYLNLDKKRTLNTTSEDIFKDPANLFEKISSHLHIEKKSTHFINYEKSTKDSNKDSNYYRDYYLQEKWKDKLSSEAIDLINSSVDKKLMEHFQYEVITYK